MFDRAFALDNLCEKPTAEAPILLSKNFTKRAHKTLQQRRDAARVSYSRNAAAGFSSLGELRVSFGLLLLPAAAGGALKLRFWSWRRDLNPRPSDYKSDALPAELRQHCTACRFYGTPMHISICQPGQTLSLTQRYSACKQPTSWISNNFAKTGSPELATPAEPVGWGFCRARPSKADAKVRSN